MATSYFSTVFDQSAGQVWSAIRDFGQYRWAGEEYHARIDNDRPGDAVGSVRIIGNDGPRQRLLAHSDLDRSYTYGFVEPAPFPIRDYVATIRITPIVDGDRAFIEWSATFDCVPEERDRWTRRFTNSFAGWLESLRAQLTPVGIHDD